MEGRGKRRTRKKSTLSETSEQPVDSETRGSSRCASGDAATFFFAPKPSPPRRRSSREMQPTKATDRGEEVNPRDQMDDGGKGKGTCKDGGDSNGALGKFFAPRMLRSPKTKPPPASAEAIEVADDDDNGETAVDGDGHKEEGDDDFVEEIPGKVAEMFLGKKERSERRKKERGARSTELMMAEVMESDSILERVSAGFKQSSFFAPPAKRRQQSQSQSQSQSSQSSVVSTPPAALVEPRTFHVRQLCDLPEIVVPSRVAQLLDGLFSDPHFAVVDPIASDSFLVSPLPTESSLQHRSTEPAVVIQDVDEEMRDDENTLRSIFRDRFCPGGNAALESGDGWHNEDEGCSQWNRAREFFASIKANSAKGRHSLWTCNCAPTSKKHMFGNNDSIASLHVWLTKWADILGFRRSERHRRLTEGEESDSDDERRGSGSLLVLSGPGCSSKSAAVTACASELGMEVIVSSASSERSGKDVANLTEEASSARQITSISASLALAGGKASTSKRGGLKPRGRRPAANDCKKRLFLFEDVDVFFPADAGLHSAILNLAQSSSYPIIATCRGMPKEVAKLCESAQVLRMATPDPRDVAFLARMCLLAERGVAGDRSDILAVASFFGSLGIRGVLNCLQFSSLGGVPNDHRFLTDTVGLQFGTLCGSLPAVMTRQIEACHFAGIDVGFDNYLDLVGSTTARSEAPVRCDSLASASECYSVLDAIAGTRNGWCAPAQALSPCSRLSLWSCDFESAIISSAVALLGQSRDATLHIRTEENYSRVPGAFAGLWPDGRPPGWLLDRTAHSADVITMAGRMAWLEALRRDARLTRRFTHHLFCCSREEQTALVGLATFKNNVRCECHTCRSKQ